jgi:hypothetical protein
LVKPLLKTPLQAVLERKLPMNCPTHLDLDDRTWTRWVGRRLCESHRLQFIGLCRNFTVRKTWRKTKPDLTPSTDLTPSMGLTPSTSFEPSR